MQTGKTKTPSQHPRRRISRFLAAEMVFNSTCDGPVKSDCVPKNQKVGGKEGMGRGGEGRKERIVVAGRNVWSLPQMMCEDSPRGIQLGQSGRSGWAWSITEGQRTGGHYLREGTWEDWKGRRSNPAQAQCNRRGSEEVGTCLQDLTSGRPVPFNPPA